VAVAFVAQDDNGGNTPVTISSFTINSGELAIVTVDTEDGTTGSQIDWGSDTDAFTLLGRATNSGVGSAEIWYAEGLSGTEDVVATLSGSGAHWVGISTWTGAGVPTDFTSETPDAQSSPQSITVPNSGADDFILDVLRALGSTNTVGADQTELHNQAAGGDEHVSSRQDGVDGGDMSWTYSGSTDLVHAGCRIPAAASGSIAPIAHHHYNTTLK
jgi:hypothetical protein